LPTEVAISSRSRPPFAPALPGTVGPTPRKRRSGQELDLRPRRSGPGADQPGLRLFHVLHGADPFLRCPREAAKLGPQQIQQRSPEGADGPLLTALLVGPTS
jgi:hypothetical protein